MDTLHWQLSVLSKAIHYKNLSGAAAHVGLSQPQLSRIISRLEGELGVTLLDRAARRKSGWTPIAHKIAETYAQSSRKLTLSLQQLTTDDQLTQLSIGSLEGMVPLANEFCRQLFEQPKLQLIELNVYELSELEERFAREEIDVIFTCREPTKHKYRFIRNLGYQSVVEAGDESKLRVFSQFEYARHVNGRPHGRRSTSRSGGPALLPAPLPVFLPVFLCNSLAVRKHWIETMGGTGFLPSEVRPKRSAEADLPVYMLASDMLNPAVWSKFEKFRL